MYIHIFFHSGIPCPSWANANTLNKGTRRPDLLEGDGTLERELLGNRQADIVAYLCTLLVEAGGYFSIENPHNSYVFKYAKIAALADITSTYTMLFDYCQYGLRPPGASGIEFTRKRTLLWTNLIDLLSLHKMCPGPSPSHVHVNAWGCAWVNGRSVHRATAAGRYPLPSAQAWAQQVAQEIRRRWPIHLCQC